MVTVLFTLIIFFFFSSRRRHTRLQGDWSSDVCSSDLANTRLDFVRTNALDQIVARRFGPPGTETEPPPGLAAKPVRLALLGSGTMAHLHAAIRVAGLRRGLWVSIFEND